MIRCGMRVCYTWEYLQKILHSVRDEEMTGTVRAVSGGLGGQEVMVAWVDGFVTHLPARYVQEVYECEPPVDEFSAPIPGDPDYQEEVPYGWAEA